MFESRLIEVMIDQELAELTGQGLSDDDVKPMECCGLLVRLGDHEFGSERVCEFGACLEYVCECGHAWATIGLPNCPCALDPMEFSDWAEETLRQLGER